MKNIIIRAGCTLRGASSRTTAWHLHILNRRFWTVMRMGMYNSKRGTNRGAIQRLKAVKNLRRSTDFPTTRSPTIKSAAVVIEPLHEFLSGENFSFSHYSEYRNSRFSSRWAPNKYLRSLAHPWFSIFCMTISMIRWMPETRRKCFSSSNIKVDLMFARRDSARDIRIQIQAFGQHWQTKPNGVTTPYPLSAQVHVWSANTVRSLSCNHGFRWCDGRECIVL